jgi:hypothetical protein
MSEKNAYKTFKNNVCSYIDRIDRIETRTLQGVPDVNLCMKGGCEMWIEIKSPTEPKRKTTPLFGSNHKVSQDQKNWFRRQLSAGGKCAFFIYTDKRVILLSGEFCDDLNEMPLLQILEKSAWNSNKPMRKEEWCKMREALLNWDISDSKHNPTPIKSNIFSDGQIEKL